MNSASWLAGAALVASCAAPSFTSAVAATATGAATAASAGAASSDETAPVYTAAGRLARPLDYRQWTFVTSGLGMTYGPAQHASSSPMFDNVFVTPESYRAFLETGSWPDRTMFVLEIRRAESNVSIDQGGRTQGAVVAVEASVKDRARFPGNGWAYFTFDGAGGLLDDAQPLPTTAACYACHANHAAVDNTFVQFYPTLLETARRLGKLTAAEEKEGDP